MILLSYPAMYTHISSAADLVYIVYKYISTATHSSSNNHIRVHCSSQLIFSLCPYPVDPFDYIYTYTGGRISIWQQQGTDEWHPHVKCFVLMIYAWPP